MGAIRMRFGNIRSMQKFRSARRFRVSSTTRPRIDRDFMDSTDKDPGLTGVCKA
jgi:hypothetical protein